MSDWNGKRVLVTGSAGFIGSHLTEALTVAGASVRAFVHYNSRNDFGWLEFADPEVMADVDIFVGDLVNPEAVAGAVEGCDCVLHLGALIPIPYSYRHPREFVSANVVGTLNVLEAVRRSDVSRLVHTSTSEVYGTPETVPITEDHPIQAQSPYAATKVGADQLVLSYRVSFDVPAVVLRPFNTFGPRQSARAVIPTIITQAIAGETIEIGTTTTTRDFVYVADTVRGIMRCGAAPGVDGEVIQLGTGVEVSVQGVIDGVSAIVGHELRVVQSKDRLRPKGSEVEQLLADPAKAHRLLGWAPEIEFDEGLRRTHAWLADAIGSYKVSLYNV